MPVDVPVPKVLHELLVISEDCVITHERGPQQSGGLEKTGAHVAVRHTLQLRDKIVTVSHRGRYWVLYGVSQAYDTVCGLRKQSLEIATAAYVLQQASADREK